MKKNIFFFSVLYFNKVKQLFFIIFLTNILSCTPMIHPAGPSLSSGQITDTLFITADGTKLPLKTWKPTEDKLNAVIIAIHGFNDYSNFFQLAGSYFSQHHKISYAYDQRGFGKSPAQGTWAGINTYTADLVCFIQLIKKKHPEKSIYLLGESMGGAIVISTITQSPELPIDGIILSAPAVTARSTMPWYQNALLWTLSHTVPWMALTGKSLGIKPSDNIKMLRALGKDPLVIKESRVENIYGLVNLMDNAFSNADKVASNTLYLYGEKDEIVRSPPTFQYINKMISSSDTHHTVAFYKNGYHMLLRDLQAPILWNDIDVWMDSFKTPLPSKADKRAIELLKEYSNQLRITDKL